MSENSNKFNDLSPEVVESDVEAVVDGVIAHRKGSKQDRFYLFWLFGLPLKSCAKLAGYKESYAYRLVQNYKNRPKTRQRVEQISGFFPEAYKSICRLRLAELADVEALAVDEYRKDPKLLIRKPALAKQIKQGAGILATDDVPTQPTIQINNIRELMHISVNRDAEAIDVTPEQSEED